MNPLLKVWAIAAGLILGSLAFIVLIAWIFG